MGFVTASECNHAYPFSQVVLVTTNSFVLMTIEYLNVSHQNKQNMSLRFRHTNWRTTY
jgi:hypothetical protein